MHFDHLRTYILDEWQQSVMPTLLTYISIPCVSPVFAADWRSHGQIDAATTLLADWALHRFAGIEGVRIERLQDGERTPLLLIDVPASGNDAAPVIIYGHLDKQPAMDGWANGRSAWSPSIEGERIYGRGGADDGYAIFSAVLAIEALHAQHLARPRCLILIEASEESSSEDLPFYIEQLAPRLGTPSLVIALDSMCATYDQLWATTSLRGQVAGTLTVRILHEGMHSGEASGIVPSPFRIATTLLRRIEDSETGRMCVPELEVAIPDARVSQAREVATLLDRAIYNQMPFVAGATPAGDDAQQMLLDRTWRAKLAVTGVDGLPPVAAAAAVLHPMIALKLSLRLPPTVAPAEAARRLTSILERDPPYGAEVSFAVDFASAGWHAPETAPWLAASLDRAARLAFGAAPAMFGGGGGIPFLNMLGERFPDAQFLVTGVLGPQSNAHGPNEFLHVPTALKVTEVLAVVLHDAAAHTAA